jgi:autotransporter-associated beta strand protein
MMKCAAKSSLVLLTTALCLFSLEASAQRQMEKLGRGVVAIRTNSTSVYVGWRMTGTDPADIGFNLYRSTAGGTAVQLTTNQTRTTDFVDTHANLALANSYFVRPVTNGVEQAASASFTLVANAPANPYLSIPLQVPAGGTTPDGVAYTYSANDCSVGDVDGDGEYEMIVKWDPSNSKDNSQSGYTGDVYLDAYKLDGTMLWRIDLGKNIRAGAHYTQFMVYDLDGDGKAEVACKTAPGTIDGQGNYVLMPGDDPTADYRNSSGYILSGPEYLTIFNGQTGAAMVTTNYNPPRGNVSSWGDSYGNRVDRFLACIAYVDGVRPTLVMCRGYYTRTVLAAWNWRDGQLTNIWTFDSNNPGNSGYAGQGNHSLSVADVDHDGKDEIIYGACAINHDGTGLYTTGLGHGDAEHVSDLNPDRPGLEVWDVHETPSGYSAGEMHDARTGQILFGFAATTDTGRGMAAHIDSAHRGFQMWSANTAGIYDDHGALISANKPSSDNFAIWWDGTVDRDLLDGSNNDGGSTGSPHIDRWTGSGTTSLLSATGCYANNSTKATPGLTADILGDWREEAIWRTADSSALRIYVSTIPATNRFYTFMHDPRYRLSVALQNVAYNQPPHTGFYIGEGMFPPPPAPVSDAKLVWRGGLATNTWDATLTRNWLTNAAWVSNLTTTFFNSGDTVLFDSTGSNTLPVQLSGSLTPAQVTVYTPTNYLFQGPGSLAGAMKLLKAGAGTLTLNTTNTYAGETAVWDGTLLVNGTLTQSPVTVWGNGWGGGSVGGAGFLGGGVTVQNGGNLVPGNGVIAGTLTISNSLAETGGAKNAWQLSDDPSGTIKNNDQIQVAGNLVLRGTNTISLSPLNGSLAPGTYALITYSGTFDGGLTNFTLLGFSSYQAALTNPPGQIAVVVSTNIPANLRWAGSAVTNWDDGVSANWLKGAALAPFHVFDNVRFDDAGVAAPAVNLVGALSPLSVVVDAAADYAFGGSGSIGGTGGLTKTNSGVLTVLTTNSYTGPTVIAGGVLTVSTLANSGVASGIGAASSDPTNLVFAGGTLRYLGPTASTDHAATFASSGGAIEVADGSSALTLAGLPSTGPGSLTKDGPGLLALGVDNVFTGGVTVNAGSLQLLSTASAGNGAVFLNGGTLVLAAAGSPATYANGLNISADSTIISPGSGNNNQAFNGYLSGAATLYLNIGSNGTFSLRGDMSGFNGTMVLTGLGFFRFYGNTGSSSAAFDLGSSAAVMYARDGGAIQLGSLTGGPGTILRGAGSSAKATSYTVGGNDADATFPGTIADGTKSPAPTAIIKVGAGAWILTGSNTYTGGTIVSNGTLLVNAGAASGTGSGAVTVRGGRLGGNGVIAGSVTVQSGGTLAQTGAIANLTIRSNLTLASGSAILMRISKTPPANDSVTVLGSLTLGGTLVVSSLSTNAFAADDSYQLFTASSFSGAFSSVVLPSLGPGLFWDLAALNTSGVLRLAPPVSAWGNSSFNQDTVPSPIGNVVAIAAGGYHCLALRADGTVIAWGDDWDGQCDVPASATNVIAIAAGAYHSLALRADGHVVAWGDDNSNECDVPAGATNVAAIAAGGWHSLALRADGTVVGWGDDGWGQNDVPADVTNVVAIAAGGEHSLALKADCTVAAWGSDLGPDGLYTGQASVPEGLSQVVGLAAGGYHSLALRCDGTVVAWGDNSQTQTNVPTGLSGVMALAAGQAHSLALREGGTVVAWGDNLEGESTVPAGLSGVGAIAAGGYNSMILLGQNSAGPRLLTPSRQGNALTVSMPTIRGKAYFLQSKASLTETNWTLLSGAVGNGGVKALRDPSPGASCRFYRVRQQ